MSDAAAQTELGYPQKRMHIVSRAAAMAVLLVISASSIAQAARSTPTPNDPRNEPTQPVEARSADQPNATSKQAEAKPAPDEPAVVEWWTMRYTGWTALFTGLLVVVGIFQLLLFWRQLRIMKQSLRDGSEMASAAKISAEAAKISSDIAQKMERAFVTVEVERTPPLGVGPRFWDTNDTTWVSVNLTLRNRGRTPAVIRLLRADLYVLRVPPTEELKKSGGQYKLPPALAIAAAGDYVLTVTRRLSREEWNEIESMAKRLYCAGKVEYDDVLGQRNETGFCWERYTGGDAEQYGVTYDEDLNYFSFHPTTTSH